MENPRNLALHGEENGEKRVVIKQRVQRSNIPSTLIRSPDIDNNLH